MSSFNFNLIYNTILNTNITIKYDLFLFSDSELLILYQKNIWTIRNKIRERKYIYWYAINVRYSVIKIKLKISMLSKYWQRSYYYSSFYFLLVKIEKIRSTVSIPIMAQFMAFFDKRIYCK